MAGRWLAVALLFDVSGFPWRSTHKKLCILGGVDIHCRSEGLVLSKAAAADDEESHMHLAEEVEMRIRLVGVAARHIHLAAGEESDCSHLAEGNWYCSSGSAT